MKEYDIYGLDIPQYEAIKENTANRIIHGEEMDKEKFPALLEEYTDYKANYVEHIEFDPSQENLSMWIFISSPVISYCFQLQTQSMRGLCMWSRSTSTLPPMMR